MPRGKPKKNITTISATTADTTTTTEVETKSTNNTTNNTTKSTTDEEVRYAGETCINHLAGEDFCIMYAGERKWYNWVLKMLEEHPEDIEVIKHYETGYRSIEVKIPYSVMSYLRWPVKYNISDEQREAIGKRLSNARKKKNKED